MEKAQKYYQQRLLCYHGEWEGGRRSPGLQIRATQKAILNLSSGESSIGEPETKEWEAEGHCHPVQRPPRDGASSPAWASPKHTAQSGKSSHGTIEGGELFSLGVHKQGLPGMPVLGGHWSR